MDYIFLQFYIKKKYNKKVEELNTIITDRDTFKAEHENATKTVADLQKKAELADKYKSDYEGLTSTIETLKTESEKKVSRIQKEYILERKLIASKAVEDGIDLLKKEFDIDALELEGDDIKNFEQVLSPIRDKRKSFFYNETIKGQEPKAGDPPKKNLNEMSVEDYAKTMGIKGIT